MHQHYNYIFNPLNLLIWTSHHSVDQCSLIKFLPKVLGGVGGQSSIQTSQVITHKTISLGTITTKLKTYCWHKLGSNMSQPVCHFVSSLDLAGSYLGAGLSLNTETSLQPQLVLPLSDSWSPLYRSKENGSFVWCYFWHIEEDIR